MKVIWGNQLIYKIFKSISYLIHLCTLLLFIYCSCFGMYQIVSWNTSQRWCHWISELLSWCSACQRDLFHDPRLSMCEESLSILDFCWSLQYLPWRNIDLGSHWVWKCYFLNIWWVHESNAWDIPWHVWGQGI